MRLNVARVKTLMPAVYTGFSIFEGGSKPFHSSVSPAPNEK